MALTSLYIFSIKDSRLIRKFVYLFAVSVTVHSVPSNTLRDAQNLCYSHKFARYVSGFWHSHAKTPRGIVACEQ